MPLASWYAISSGCVGVVQTMLETTSPCGVPTAQHSAHSIIHVVFCFQTDPNAQPLANVQYSYLDASDTNLAVMLLAAYGM